MNATNTSAIRVKEIAFTGYPVTDMERARAFYENLLGLKRSADWESGGRHWIEYDIGGGTLAITNMSPEWRPASAGPAVALEVEDFEVAVAALRAAGTPFTVEPGSSPLCRLAVVTDPDGNCLAIHQRNLK